MVCRSSGSLADYALEFIDFEKAFDCKYSKTLEALNSQGIERPYIEVLENLYKEAIARVKNMVAPLKSARALSLNVPKTLHSGTGTNLSKID